MTRGTVKKWIESRGFGFIARDGEADVFAHIKEVEGDLDALLPGDVVEFEIGAGRDGRPQARNVRLVERLPETA